MGRNFLLVACVNTAGRHISLVLWGKGTNKSICVIISFFILLWILWTSVIPLLSFLEVPSATFVPVSKSQMQVTFEKSNFPDLFWSYWGSFSCFVLFCFSDSLLFPSHCTWIICFGQIFHQIIFSQMQQSPLVENYIFYNITLAPGSSFPSHGSVLVSDISMDFPDKINSQESEGEEGGTAQSWQLHRPHPFIRAVQMTLLITCFEDIIAHPPEMGETDVFSARYLHYHFLSGNRMWREAAGNSAASLAHHLSIYKYICKSIDNLYIWGGLALWSHTACE